MDIQGNVFVVTGGGNGIGREVVLELLRRDAGGVAALDVSADGLEGTARLAGGARLSTHRVDITDRSAVRACVDEVVSRHGRVDGLVNVAGIIQPFVRIADLDVEHVERVMGVNFWGVVHLTQACLPLLLARPAAALVNVSSMGAFVAVPGQTAYGASKAAVKLFTEGLWAELRGTAVAVTAVYPGAIATDITAHSGVAGPADASESPLPMTAPDDAGRQIVDGIERGAWRVVIGKDARALDALSRLSPRRATALIARKLEPLLQR